MGINVERFWSKVNIIYDRDSCWEWQGCKNPKKYGNFVVNRITNSAHRISWELSSGFIPPGVCVLHRCDNPSCVRPSHLFLGTIADNNKDKEDKNRAVVLHGENHWRAKLSNNDVRLIKQDLKSGKLTHRELAQKFKISNSTISSIAANRNWKHIQ